MAEDAEPSTFDRIHNHDANDIIEESLKFRWRHTTLKSDFHDLKQLYNTPIPHSTERSRQLETQGYVFEVERLLHHYLSGLYSLLQQQDTLQNGVGDEFRSELSRIKNDYMGKETSRTVVGLRHYIQHENVLPLQSRTSKLDGSNSLVVIKDDLHRIDDDRNFNQHFGHVQKPYIEPVEWIIDNWPDVQSFSSDTEEIMREQTKDELDEYEKLSQEVGKYYEELREKLLSDEDEGSP